MYAQFIEKLVGSHFVGYSRICDMVCLRFRIKEGSSDMREYGLHIQCGFRILSDEKIIACSEDMFNAQQDNQVDKFSYDVDDSILDDSMVKWINSGEKIVTFVELLHWGDLVIKFSDLTFLHIYLNTIDSETEAWRFILGEKEPHLICSAGDLELIM